MGKLHISMSQLPLSDHDYINGEIHKLIPGSPIWEALHGENWENCSAETRDYYLDRLTQEHYFSGTVVSLPRGQVELTYVPKNPVTGGPGEVKIISITLPQVQRFV